jgi:hypothetical protein
MAALLQMTQRRSLLGTRRKVSPGHGVSVFNLAKAVPADQEINSMQVKQVKSSVYPFKTQPAYRMFKNS